MDDVDNPIASITYDDINDSGWYVNTNDAAIKKDPKNCVKMIQPYIDNDIQICKKWFSVWNYDDKIIARVPAWKVTVVYRRDQ